MVLRLFLSLPFDFQKFFQNLFRFMFPKLYLFFYWSIKKHRNMIYREEVEKNYQVIFLVFSLPVSRVESQCSLSLIIMVWFFEI